MAEDKFYFENEKFSLPNFKFTFDFDKSLLNEILKYKNSGKVLDLGCGEGGIDLELSRRGFEVTCVDISKTATEKILEEAKKRKLKIKTICADLENYNLFGDFDVIIFTGVSHFIPREIAKKIVQEIQEHTTKNGLNVIDVLTGKDFFLDREIKKIYSDWKILEFEEYSESFGEMNYILAER